MSADSMFVSPVQSACSLPPIHKHDVIEIDSDDDNTSDIQPCSSYQECNRSKTPPCVLREHENQAEKNFIDIVDLTESESIYAPYVVEGQLELELAKLDATIINLQSLLNDKDQDIEILKNNITNAQDEIKSIAADKAKLETTCNNYCIDIIEWELSFGTLNKNSKSREDELLSLLEEQKSKKENETFELQETVSSLNDKIAQLETENSNLKYSMDNLKKTISSQQSLIEIANTDIESYCSVIRELHIKLSKKENAITDISNTDLETVANEEMFIANNKNMENIIQSLKKDSRNKEINKLKSDLDNNQNHSSLEEFDSNKTEISSLTNLSISQNVDLGENAPNEHLGNTSENNINLSNVPEKIVLDMYFSDKTDCLNYYCEKTGIDKESLNGDFKILEVMKMLYVNFSTKHANEIQNLVNKLKDFVEAESENLLKTQLIKLMEEQSAFLNNLALLKDLKEEKDGHIQRLNEIVSHILYNISLINEESEDAVIVFRTDVLKILDKEFGLTSSNIYESILQKLNEQHNKVTEKTTTEIAQIKETTERMVIKLNSLNDNISSMKSQLKEKESALEMLQRQEEKMHEISNAVKIDIIRKEKELKSQLTHYYRKLIEGNIIKEDIDLSLPVNESMNILFDFILNQLKNKENMALELENLKICLIQKDKDLQLVREDFNKKVTEYEQKLFTQTSLHDDLNKIYAKKVEENEFNANAINKLTEEINLLKNNISSKEASIKSLETKHSQDLLEWQSQQIQVQKNLHNVQKEFENLKSINQNILMEKEACAIDLEDVRNIISQKNLEIDKFVLEINDLKQSLHENSQVIENLKLKSNNLLQKLQERCSNCVRLETNVKTHEKMNSIILNKLQELKADFVQSNSEKDKQIKVSAPECKSLEKESLKLTTEIQTAKKEITKLSNLKQTLELQISELKTVDAETRLSIDSVADTTRLRTQSIHDTKRTIADDVQDPKTFDGILENQSNFFFNDDLSFDFDENSSSRSTPIRLSTGRDSLLSKQDQGYRDGEQSRPGSAAEAARLRRRTAHDRHRLAEDSFESSGIFEGSEAAHFRILLSVCQKELEELKQGYKEVVDKLPQPKTSLEQQLTSVEPQYIVTGSATIQTTSLEQQITSLGMQYVVTGSAIIQNQINSCQML